MKPAAVRKKECLNAAAAAAAPKNSACGGDSLHHSPRTPETCDERCLVLVAGVVAATAAAAAAAATVAAAVTAAVATAAAAAAAAAAEATATAATTVAEVAGRAVAHRLRLVHCARKMIELRISQGFSSRCAAEHVGMRAHGPESRGSSAPWTDSRTAVEMQEMLTADGAAHELLAVHLGDGALGASLVHGHEAKATAAARHAVSGDEGILRAARGAIGWRRAGRQTSGF